VNVQFDWWLLIVGFVVGAGLTGLVLAELRRREDDLAAREREAEAAWIAIEMTGHGIPADDEAVGEVLRLHRLYLASLSADDSELDEIDQGVEPASGTSWVARPDPPDVEGDGPDSSMRSAPDTREDARRIG
jgi:hypothetical protein